MPVLLLKDISASQSKCNVYVHATLCKISFFYKLLWLVSLELEPFWHFWLFKSKVSHFWTVYVWYTWPFTKACQKRASWEIHMCTFKCILYLARFVQAIKLSWWKARICSLIIMQMSFFLKHDIYIVLSPTQNAKL